MAEPTGESTGDAPLPPRVVAAGLVVGSGADRLERRDLAAGRRDGRRLARGPRRRRSHRGRLGGRPATFVSLPEFKSADAYRFPVERDRPGATTAPGPASAPTSPTSTVIVCDALFVRDCGGPAEDGLPRVTGPPGDAALRLVDRWMAAPGRTISVYVPPT